MDCCNTGKMMPLAEAKKKLSNAVTVITETLQSPIEDALDRILAEDVHSDIQVPGYDNSAMDGFAFKASELDHTDTLTLIGKSFAGSPFQGKISSGECIRIMTGAAVPDDVDTVVMQERTNAQGETSLGDRITFSNKPSPLENIRKAGEDINKGDTILTKGRRLTPTDIGLLASIGIDHVCVYRPIKVGIFSTGDELRLPGETLESGCLYDSNRFVLKAMLQRLGADVVDLGIVRDNPAELEKAFLYVAEHCDAMISSGGVSVGEADYTKDVLDKLGNVGFWKVAIKPGKPFAFGTIGHQQLTPEKTNQNSLAQANNTRSGSCYFFGLPGNPVSATVTFHQLALPMLREISGEVLAEPFSIKVPAKETIRKTPGRTDFQRGNIEFDQEGNPLVKPTGSQGSGILSSLSNANCYLILEQDHGLYETGEAVEIQPFDRWLG